MGVRNYLIEGGSGTGKTTVAEELERRGYHVIHGDRTLAYVGDPETGEALAGPPHGSLRDNVTWDYDHWIWPVDKVKALIADRAHPATFFCGGSRNSQHFIDLFDEVFVLEVDLETLRMRLAWRPED
jgi:broad-specificity NMP kinase